MAVDLSTIVVDLTPVLPRGENGGAKIFAMELVRLLAELAPSTQFVLLTQEPSHEELAVLDRHNVRRAMVVESSNVTAKISLRRVVSSFLRYLPSSLRNAMWNGGLKLRLALKRRKCHTLLRDLGADLLFCPFTAPTYWEQGIPTISTIYDFQYDAYPNFFPPEDVIHRRRIFEEACRKATVLAAISEYSKASAISLGMLPESKVETIYLRMAKRLTTKPHSDEAVLEQHRLLSKRYLIYPANFWEHKNHERLFDAFHEALSTGLLGDIKLVCTGSPSPRLTMLQRKLDGLGLRERVVFPGYCTDSELAALVVNACGVVFPSLYEGFGLPVIEAMASGIPVACSNVTSLPEIAAGAAILFDPNMASEISRAIQLLVSDDLLRRQCIDAGVARAKEFSDSYRMANEYLALFRHAISLT